MRLTEESWANDVRPYGVPFQEPRGDVGIAPYNYPWASLPSPFPLGDGLTRRKSDKFCRKNRAACPNALWISCGKRKKAVKIRKKFALGLDKHGGIRYNIW